MMTGGGSSCLPAEAGKIQVCHGAGVAEGRFELGNFHDLRSWWKGVTTIPAGATNSCQLFWNPGWHLWCIRDMQRGPVEEAHPGEEEGVPVVWRGGRGEAWRRVSGVRQRRFITCNAACWYVDESPDVTVQGWQKEGLNSQSLLWSQILIKRCYH